jgi:hypothetical protein
MPRTRPATVGQFGITRPFLSAVCPISVSAQLYFSFLAVIHAGV